MMRFFDKVKKAFGSKREDVESQNSDENIVNDEKADGTDFLQVAQRQEIELSPNRNILFVCASNMSISPIAEAIFNQFSGDLQAFSAGLNAQSGNRASQDAIKVCQKHGIELSDHVTANINDFFLDDIGLILTSTAHIRDALKMKFPDAQIFTIKEYAGGYSDLDISDPFTEGLASHVECFMEINEAVIKIIRKDMGVEAEEVVERPAAIVDESIPEAEVLSDGKLIVVSGIDGNLDYYNQYLSLWDKNDPDCHIVFLGNLIYSTEDDDGSLEILDDAIEKSQNYSNFHYLLGINELSCIMDENIYKIGINLKTKFENLIISKKGSLEPYLSEYADFFKKLPYFIKTKNGLFMSYSGPSGTVKSLEDIGSDLNLLHDFLWARKGEYESSDVEVFLDALGLKFMVVGNMPCDGGYDVFSRQLIISSGDSGENKSYLDIDLDEDIDSMEDLVECVKSIDGIVKVDEDSVSVEKEVAEKSNEIKNFKYLDDLIHSGVKEIVLDSDIILGDYESFEYDDGIKLDVDGIVIDGNDHVIDGANVSRIFSVIEKNITLKNITFKNGYTHKKYNYPLKGNGGTIIILSNANLTIKDCKFINNASEGNGGTIYNMGNLTILTSIFNENNAYNGGAICNEDGELTLSDCTFNENISNGEYSNGGVVYVKNGFLTISDCIFNENVSKYIAGAIYGEKCKIDISNSKFINNTSRNSGGAIYIYGKSKLTVKETKFNLNKSNDNGGAIENNGGELKISDSRFIRNASNGSGGAVYNYGHILTISDSIFSENMSEYDGGAINNTGGNFKIFNCLISKNKSPYNIIYDEDSLQIFNTKFDKNNAKHIIESERKSNLGIFHVEFIDNQVTESIIFNCGKYCVIEKSTFENNISHENSKNIINQSDLTLIDPKIMEENKTVLNNGHILIKKSKQNLLSKIDGEGTVEIDTNIIPTDEKFDFGYLDKKIHESTTKKNNFRP